MIDSWKKTVRTGLRGQAIVDLHDYLDVHRNIKGVVEGLRARILQGIYRPGEAEVITVEKTLGICRRLVLPSPEDAVVFQTIVDFIEPKLAAVRPSDSAFYSRSHSFPTVERIDGTFSYPWWELWPEFQERIFEFTASTPYLVVTDIATYYDGIPLESLRRQVAKFTGVEGPLLDLLFFMLESFVWRPDYIPLPRVGLPQINFDAPRLLAHAYLFPIDRLLKERVGENFVRWMDDIDFGVRTLDEGRRLLRDLDSLLCSYGVHLNTGKTGILTSQGAAEYFWVTDNRALNVMRNLSESSIPQVRAKLKKKLEESYGIFKKKLTKKKVGQWSKVAKRYLGLLGKVGSTRAQGDAIRFINERPALRSSAFRYLERLGYTPRRFGAVHRFITDHCIDDASLFDAAKLLVDWHIPSRSNRVRMAADIATQLPTLDSPVAGFIAGLWLVSKYGTRKQLKSFLQENRGIWLQSDWGARQVVTVLGRCSESKRREIRRQLLRGGQFGGLRVLDHLDEIKQMKRLDQQLRAFLLPSEGYEDRVYPLKKILLLAELSWGKLCPDLYLAIRNDVIGRLQDKVYVSLLLSCQPKNENAF